MSNLHVHHGQANVSNRSNWSTGRSENVEQSGHNYIKEKWKLPNERIGYISTHKAIEISKLHDHNHMLKPVWTKITKTPWQDRAALCGGYGMRMQILNSSHDAPDQMKLHHTSNIDKQFATSDRKIRSLATTKRIVIPCESAYVLPAGASILAATQVAKTGNSETMGYKTYLYNKQRIIDQIPNEPKREELSWSKSERADWAPARSRSARSQTNRISPNQSSGNRNLYSR